MPFIIRVLGSILRGRPPCQNVTTTSFVSPPPESAASRKRRVEAEFTRLQIQRGAHALGIERPHIHSPDGLAPSVAQQSGDAVRVKLHCANCLEASGFKAYVKPAGPGKQANGGWLRVVCPSAPTRVCRHAGTVQCGLPAHHLRLRCSRLQRMQSHQCRWRSPWIGRVGVNR